MLKILAFYCIGCYAYVGIKALVSGEDLTLEDFVIWLISPILAPLALLLIWIFKPTR